MADAGIDARRGRWLGHGTRAWRAGLVMSAMLGVTAACGGGSPRSAPSAEPAVARSAATEARKYLLERVDDAAVAQIYADGFEALPLREKTLVWHLYLAALAGRDIFYDQRYAHNLEMREVLEEILTHAEGVDGDTLREIERYTKLFWLNTGPYNNLTARKFVLQCTPAAFARAARAAAEAGARFPLRPGETLEAMLRRMEPLFFDPAVDPIVTNKTPGPGRDILQASANNLYVGVTMKDLEGFVEKYPLNSRLVKRDGRLVEEVYRIGGRYDREIAAIVKHLEDAVPYATEPMAKALRALIRFYRTGETADRVAYDIAWVQDRDSPVDTINGFVEVYLDARGQKGAWEALVFYVNREKTQAIRTLAAAAQWFEDHMPWDPQYRKSGVRGITANAIDVVVETGDSGPITPIGINLPNDQTIRETYGSKSVSLSNVIEAYERSTSPAFRREFAWTPDEAARAEKWSAFAGELTTNMHEVIGHASGKVSDRLRGAPQAALREHYSALEEARADLVALYFLPDPKLVELGLVRAADHAEVVQAEYEGYTRNALVQLRRVREGTQIEEDHMRNRQMIVHWLMANTKAVDVRRRDGKTYYVMTDARAFREGVGRLLAEVQRIKAEGDYAAARRLFETYGIHFDPKLRDEVVSRVAAVDMPSYTGFVMPRLEAVYGPGGEIVDVKISYPQDLKTQMLEYSGKLRRGGAAR
jgi:dipeptidyl-peptidase-3